MGLGSMQSEDISYLSIRVPGKIPIVVAVCDDDAQHIYSLMEKISKSQSFCGIFEGDETRIRMIGYIPIKEGDND